MKLSLHQTLALSLATLSTAQNVTVPNTCTTGFSAGTDTVVYTIPYTYAQALSIIGSYKNLTWSGNPASTVTLNGSDNTVGTARSYSLAGANVIETLLIYDSPPNGPYYEVHNLAQLSVPSFGNVSVYASYDGTTVTSTCNGLATTFNLTANFCATNVSEAAAAFHLLHMTDVVTVGVFLGGQNYSSCAALEGNNATGSATASASGPVQTYHSGAVGAVGEVRGWTVVLMAAVVGVVAML